MGFIADAVCVSTGSGDQKVQRLHAGVAGALRHDVEKLSVGLCVQLVEDYAVDVEAVLGIRFRRQHLVEAVRRRVNDALLRGENLHALAERRAHSHHISSHLEYNAGLLAVGCAAVYLGALLAVTAAKQKSDGSGQLALTVLLRDFHISSVELPVAVGLQDAEQIPYDLLLPVQQQEGFSRPSALGVTQVLYESHSKISSISVVMAVLRLEDRGLVAFQLFRVSHLLGQKN